MMSTPSRPVPDDRERQPVPPTPAIARPVREGGAVDAARPLASDPLRREAEREWAASDRAAAQRKQRGRTKTHARAERREKARAQEHEIARLKDELDEANRKLARGPKRGKAKPDRSS